MSAESKKKRKQSGKKRKQAAPASPDVFPVSSDPEAERLFQIALSMHRNKRWPEAIEHYSLAVERDSGLAHYHNNLGAALRARDKYEAARACYERALALDPEYSGACTNLGNVCRHMGDLDAARSWHERALELNPDMVEARYNLGLTLHEMGLPDEAIELFDEILAVKPDRADVRWDRALACLVRGDIRDGFDQYEWRWTRPELTPRPFRQPFWDGGPAEGKTLLLYAEQGNGDTLNFIRYVPLAADASGARVVVEVQPGLKRLVAGMEGAAQVVAKGEQLPEFDLRLPMLSLPRVLGTDMDTIPSACPYLHPPQGAGFMLPRPAGVSFRVGIIWAGKPSHKNDRNRSADFREFLPLAAVPGVALYSLQVGPRSVDLEEHGCRALVRDLSRGLRDFADTAAVMKQLDLVISVDTAPAHLAGALNVPVWTLIPHNPDWRWMLDREDTPWYPSMRLYRRTRAGNWAEVLDRVRFDLQNTVAQAVQDHDESRA